MFEEVNEKMNKHVTIDVGGNKVIARCNGKTGVARCHPDDDFSFYTGAKLALERLEEAENPYGWLKVGTKYYTPDILLKDLHSSYRYDADSVDERYKERGIVYQTPEEAIACAKKMLEAVKQEG
jgi:hypothetical protein